MRANKGLLVTRRETAALHMHVMLFEWHGVASRHSRHTARLALRRGGFANACIQIACLLLTLQMQTACPTRAVWLEERLDMIALGNMHTAKYAHMVKVLPCAKAT